MKELLPNLYQAAKMANVGPLKVPSAMHIVKAGEETVLIDPFVLSESEAEALDVLGKPAFILITGTWHLRDAEAYGKRYGAKILANREAVPKLVIAVDDAFGDGETLPGGLTAITMFGTTPGETVFQHNPEAGTLITGDALMNFQPGERGLLMRLIGFPEGLDTMPKLFMKDKKLAAESYQKLLDYDFDQILVSHGAPILSGAKEMLRIILEKQ